MQFSELSTVCNCTIAAHSPKQRRRLDSAGNVISSTSLQLVATGEYVLNEFAETFTAAPNLTTISAIEDVTIVIVMFSTIWFSGFLLFLLSFWAKYSKRNKKESKNRMNSSPALPDSLETNVQKYISEAIPSVFLGVTKSFKILEEVVKHHKYVSLVLSKEPKASRIVQFVTAMSLLMFLLAFLYDLQCPSDDGSCTNWQTEAACTARKSYLDSSQSYCKWNTVSDDGSASNSPGLNDFCSYQDPVSTVQEVLSISVIASIFTALFLRPIEYLLEILEAPTATRPSTKLAIVKRKRKIHPITAEASNKHISQNNIAGLSVRDISEDVAVARAVARKSIHSAILTNPRRTVMPSTEGETRPTTADIFDGLNGVETLNHFNRFTEHFRKQLGRQRLKLKLEEREHFDYQWGLLATAASFESNDQDEPTAFVFEPEIHRKILREMSSVRLEASKRISKLKLLGDEQAGLELLHLFIIDILGRHSPAAKIFASKLDEDFKETKVIHQCWKFAALLALLTCNIFLFYYTILYASVRGLSWQWLFLSACIAQLFIELFINETLECLWLNYFVPLLAAREVTIAHKVLLDLTDKFCKNSSPDRIESLNAPDYLFISTTVSKAFPHLMESSIVDLYRSHLPGESAKHWHKTMLSAAFDEVAVLTGGEGGWNRVVRYSRVPILSLLSLLEFCGTLPYLLQRMFVRFCQPFVVSGLAFLTSLIIQSPISISISIIFVIGIFILMFRGKLKEISNIFKINPFPVVETTGSDSKLQPNSDLVASASSDESSESSSLSFNVSLPDSSDESLILNISFPSSEYSNGCIDNELASKSDFADGASELSFTSDM